MLKAHDDWGWPSKVNTYTFRCQEDYPQFMSAKGIGGPKSKNIWHAENDNTWEMFCDGRADRLVIDIGIVIISAMVLAVI